MTSFGRYELRGALGEGGFATVYRAWDAMLEREVALKLLHPHMATNADIRRRFLAEARALARLRHPNIVVVHEVGEADGRSFFTMELIEGRTLAAIGARGPLPPAEVLRIVQSLAGAVDAMHAAGFIHRDIKVGNVMVERGGRVVLMDFGIARTAERAASQVRARGYESGVLLSTEYRSLRPGYWVVYSGRFATEAEAAAHAERLRRAGYTTAYPRELAR
jgi:serine/threonine-protein kinase